MIKRYSDIFSNDSETVQLDSEIFSYDSDIFSHDSEIFKHNSVRIQKGISSRRGKIGPVKY